MEDISKADLYGMLGVDPTATQSDIKKAYRKKALECHPDKNPDNPEAVKLFQKLSKALEILTDVAAKAAYDAVLRAKVARAVRNRELDSKRKKFKEDLEAREAAAAKEHFSTVDATKKLQKEIERLRTEGSKELQKEREYMKKHIEEQLREEKKKEWKPVLKISWKAEKTDTNNGGYSHDVLSKILGSHGTILFLIVSPKKKGSAVVEFEDVKAALNVFEKEAGLSENPLKFTWVHGEPKISLHTSTYSGNIHTVLETGIPKTVPQDVYEDYENYVLMNLKRAAERKQEIENLNTD